MPLHSLQCDKCDYVTNRLLRLRTHKKKPHFLCEQCPYVGSSRELVARIPSFFNVQVFLMKSLKTD